MTVLYEDAQARNRVADFCNRIAQRFWGQFEFDVSWSSFESLASEGAANEAAKRAIEADFVVFGIRLDDRVPPHVKRWVEKWLEHRGEHEGALVSVPSSGDLLRFETSAMCHFLRSVAHRGGMDYLTEVPQSLSQLFPDSPESCEERARQVTILLSEILHFPPPRTNLPPDFISEL